MSDQSNTVVALQRRTTLPASLPQDGRQGSNASNAALERAVAALSSDPWAALKADHIAHFSGAREARLAEILRIERGISNDIVACAEAMVADTHVIDPRRSPPDPAIVSRFGPRRCLETGLLPHSHVGGATLILTCRSEQFARHRPELETLYGPLRMAITTEAALGEARADRFGATLAAAAETRSAPQDSCREWCMEALGKKGAAAALALLALTLAVPAMVMTGFVIIATLVMLTFTALKLTAAVLHLRGDHGNVANVPVPAFLPTISIMVPLFKEREIAAHLLQRLQRLDYPRASLDVVLVLEADDDTTVQTVAQTRLPRWMRVVQVPPGTLKTKPRALNYALDFCRGSIIGIYDAEDRPAPDQLHKVAARFGIRGPEVACLQGVLDYYNAADSWLSRCFAVEYATWFRMVLPGLERLGLAVPLGGTTLFFRRAALEHLGGWDAHNVTEDADLGIRLHRYGYRTELIDTVTEEEANDRLWPWVRQRSRWLKGYALTWGVHMARPGALLCDLGPWRFFGVQVLLLGTLVQVLLAPLLWSFWVVLFGVWHPVQSVLPEAMMIGLAATFALCELASILVAMLAVRAAGHKWLTPWVPTLHFYHPLATLAALKAAWELITKPFYWDKTTHGRSLETPPPLPHRP